MRDDWVVGDDGLPDAGDRISIPAAALEFTVEGNTIWVIGPDGSTLLRIKTTGKMTASKCETSPASHADVVVHGDIKFCLGKDAEF